MAIGKGRNPREGFSPVVYLMAFIAICNLSWWCGPDRWRLLRRRTSSCRKPVQTMTKTNLDSNNFCPWTGPSSSAEPKAKFWSGTSSGSGFEQVCIKSWRRKIQTDPQYPSKQPQVNMFKCPGTVELSHFLCRKRGKSLQQLLQQQLQTRPALCRPLSIFFFGFHFHSS